jgi:sulfate adenylyltransferase (ADP) / ATP adenylyltransferase
MLAPGTLWTTAVERAKRALDIGALKPIATTSEMVRDHGIDFIVRSVSSLARKTDDAEKQKSVSNTALRNPFLPYEEALFVADITQTHVCLLNKFNVIDNHLLIVTRSYQEQERLLNLEDFEALWMCMAEFDALAFYNGGPEAGASQAHKHLQMIPLPMINGGLKVPVEGVIKNAAFTGSLGTSPLFAFVHAIAKLNPRLIENPRQAAREIIDLYCLMLDKVGLKPSHPESDDVQRGPYNLLLTREWMFLVPRSRGYCESISINALGYAGALLVRDKEHLRALKEIGPLRVLAHTALAVD